MTATLQTRGTISPSSQCSTDWNQVWMAHVKSIWWGQQNLVTYAYVFNEAVIPKGHHMNHRPKYSFDRWPNWPAAKMSCGRTGSTATNVL